MLSPGGKVEWFCPHCGGGRLVQFRNGRGGLMKFTPDHYGECLDCQTWWPWASRIKKSLKEK